MHGIILNKLLLNNFPLQALLFSAYYCFYSVSEFRKSLPFYCKIIN